MYHVDLSGMGRPEYYKSIPEFLRSHAEHGQQCMEDFAKGEAKDGSQRGVKLSHPLVYHATM